MASDNSHLFVSILFTCLSLAGVTACDDDSGPYGDGYYPGGVVGAFCQFDQDCSTAYCCRTPPCGHGMCSYACRADMDCPLGSLCEGGTCFLACRSDYDCLVGQHCAHGKTVCQY